MNEREDQALSIRDESKNTLESDFINSTTKPKEHYDRREYMEYWPWMFSKTLTHDEDTGFAKKIDIQKIIDAHENADESSLITAFEEAVPKILEGFAHKKLEGVGAAKSFNLIGTDSFVPTSDNFYEIESKKGLFEMAEVYVKSLVRDIAFSNFNQNTTEIVDYKRFLNNFGEISIIV